MATLTWYAWQDTLTGERYGESDMLAVATKISERLANEAIIDGEPKAITVFFEPSHEPLAQVALGGKFELLD